MQKLVNKQSHKLTLTPQLTQSLKVLAMSAAELETHIEECLESNPMLERDAPSSTDSDQKTDAKKEEANIESGDDRWEQMYTSKNSAPSDNTFEQLIKDELPLIQQLHNQVDLQPMSDREHLIAHAIIDTLTDEGYFTSDIKNLAKNIGCKLLEIEEVLEDVVHHLEPAGIGARSVPECLLLQLDDDQAVDCLAKLLLTEYSENLEKTDVQLARTLDTEPSNIAEARGRMRRLDPYPGHGMRGNENIYVRPEIIFRKNSDGSFSVEVPTYSHGVKIDQQWQSYQFQGSDKDFMGNAAREAKWLMYALDQRRATLLKVAAFLLNHQRDFLEVGSKGLKPLTLQNVASAVDLHESTISRVTNGKYAQTPLGIIELKKFFSAGLPTRDGDTISVYKVQSRIKALIKAESPKRPISDQALADRLKIEGIKIARRTVAKYRELLDIPSTSQRRRIARQSTVH